MGKLKITKRGRTVIGILTGVAVAVLSYALMMAVLTLLSEEPQRHNITIEQKDPCPEWSRVCQASYDREGK